MHCQCECRDIPTKENSFLKKGVGKDSKKHEKH
jgi:hypothetical protein